jgi:hypothetical protein
VHDSIYDCADAVPISLEASLEMMIVPAPTAIAAPTRRRDRFSMLAVVADVDDVVAGEEEVLKTRLSVVVGISVTTLVVGRAEFDDCPLVVFD